MNRYIKKNLSFNLLFINILTKIKLTNYLHFESLPHQKIKRFSIHTDNNIIHNKQSYRPILNKPKTDNTHVRRVHCGRTRCFYEPGLFPGFSPLFTRRENPINYGLAFVRTTTPSEPDIGGTTIKRASKLSLGCDGRVCRAFLFSHVAKITFADAMPNLLRW